MLRKSGVVTVTNLFLPELRASSASDKVLQQKLKDFVCLNAQNRQFLFDIADSEDKHKVDIPLENGLTHFASECFPFIETFRVDVEMSTERSRNQ